MQDTTPATAQQYLQLNKELSDQCSGLVQTVADTQAWITANPELVTPGAASSLEAELRKAALTFSKCGTAANRKMCVGVFGPSQAGKSYLISTLACPQDGTLMADFSGEQHDFISEINPIGSKESTGLVTRFTATRPAGAPQGAPVHLRMLTEGDIICILTNTYYADCIHEEEPSPEEARPALTAADDRLGAQNGLPRAQVEEVREYITRHFAAQPRVMMLKNIGFWDKALEWAPQLSPADRGRLFGCLWNGEEEFVNLYVRLAEALQAIGNPDCAWCPLAVLIPRTDSIIDVAQLKNLQNPDEGRITVISENGASAELPRSVITALTAELTIYMPEKPDIFFDYTDLLDFPGYRSRLAVPDLTASLRKGELSTFYLRGKVAYLFHRYCEERELTSMLLCIGDGPQETAAVLRPAVKSWIDAIHGNTAQSRAGVEPALFVILTKIDTIFERKAGAPSLEGRWDARLESSLLEPFKSSDDPWTQNWDGKPFNNVYMLRNPKIQSAMFSFDDNKKETGIRSDYQSIVDQVKGDYDKSESVHTHMREPEVAFASMLALNDGGVSFLREHLRPLCNPDLKRNQIRTVVRQWQDRLHAQLAHYWVNDDKEEERRAKEARTQRLAGYFANLIKNNLFGDFLHALQVNDHDLLNLYKKIEQERLQQPDSASDIENADTSTTQDDILLSVFGSVEPPQPAAQPEKAAPQPENAAPQRMDSATRFATMALNEWTQQLRDFAASDAAQNYFSFPAAELRFFVDELTVALRRNGLPERLSQALRRAADFGNTQQEHILWRQASITAAYINGFVDWLGFDPATCDALRRTVCVNEQTSVVFTPPPPVQGTPHIEEKPANYTQNYSIDWLKALAHSISANTDYSDGVAINREQNNRLGTILRSFGAHNATA